MKYYNFKTFKFSTFFKKLNRLKDDFLEISKKIQVYFVKFFKFSTKYISSKSYKSSQYLLYDLTKKYKFIKYKFFYKYFGLTKYNSFSIKRLSFFFFKKLSFLNNKFIFLHFPAIIIFFTLLYLIIPTFYNYNNSNIEKAMCPQKNIECSIKGKIDYSFFPTPRITANNVIVNHTSTKEKTLIKAKDVIIKLSIKNLLVKEKHKFNKIEARNYEINFNFKNLKEYKKIFKEKTNYIPFNFFEGKIIFFNGVDYVGTISSANLDSLLENHKQHAKLRGKFLGTNIYVNLNNKKIDNKLLTELVLKMPRLDLYTKVNFSKSGSEKNLTNGNILIKNKKLRFTGIYDYKENEITIIKSNIQDSFLEGKLKGKIKFLPYFNFDLDLSLNSLNFTKLYNHFLAIDIEEKKNLFKINKKINGNLSLSSEKIYSNYNLIKSFESRLKFNNGNILVDQFLINLGKLGAADILGEINNNKKFTNFKYESNIFVENNKKFLSKFGIYNKESIPSDVFISGNFDLHNLKVSFYEISTSEQFAIDDVNFIEKEFNDLMLIDGYESLFRFPKFKEFIKSILSEEN